MIRTNPEERPVLSDIVIDVLVCPRDQADLKQHGPELICVECGVRYQIRNGVPDMLIDGE